MRKRKCIIWITIVLLLIGVTAAFAYGKTNAENKAGKDYFEALNDYDWSKTCPGASCRERNAEEN